MKENEKYNDFDNINNKDELEDEDANQENNDLKMINNNLILFNDEKENNLQNEGNHNQNNIDEEERQSLSIDSDYNQEKEILNQLEIELGSKIFCPEVDCFSNSVILLNPIFFEVNSDCGEHKNKMDIINFVKYSGISKEGKETCDICKTCYTKIINNKKILYKCLCGKNICEICKNSHLQNNNINEHILVDYKIKDYTCFCNNNSEHFIGYCYDCTINYCSICQNGHTGHKTLLFENSDKEKEKLKKKLIEQKNMINKFKNLVDRWFERVKEFFDSYKTKLDLYYKINKKIIELYDPNKLYYKSIKNLEYLRFDFEDIVINLIKEENKTKLHNEIICKFLNDNMGKYVELKNNKINELEHLENKYTKNIEGYVNNICELKKKELLIVNIRETITDYEHLFICAKSADYKLNEIYCTDVEDKITLDIFEMKNGNILMLQKKNFQIFKSNEIGFFQKIEIQKFEGLMDISQIIELTNGYLISINDSFLENEIIFWKKNLIKGEYEIYKRKTLNEAKYIIEYDRNSFLVYCVGNKLYLFDSNTGKGKYLGTIKTESASNFKKMMKIGEKGVLFFYSEYLIMLNMETLIYVPLIKSFHEIYYSPNSKTSFIGSFSEKINKQKMNGIYKINCDLIKNEINYEKSSDNIHSDVINKILSLSNGDLITCSLDNSIKSWRIIEKKNNNGY